MSAEVPQLSDADFEALKRLVLQLTGISLSDSKRLLLQSRLLPRLHVHHLETFSDYRNLLKRDDVLRDEAQELINCVTTNKTSFFREPHQFVALTERWVPALQQEVARGRPKVIRAWSAACSTGAEPWTLAMVLFDSMPDLASWDVKILASDIDTDVLRRAREGLYTEDELTGVSNELRARHFDALADGRWRIKEHLRRLITFKRINFLDAQWPIHSRLDLVLCRNASIYFDQPTQRRLFERLTDQLTPGGWLLVGHAEVLRGFEGTLQSRPGGFYRRRVDALANAPQFTPLPSAPGPAPSRPSAPPPVSAPRASAPPPHPSAPAPAPGTPKLAEHVINVGELHASAQPAVVQTLLGSCVAAALYDPVSRVGGMNHFLLPDANGEPDNRNRFGIHAMETLINSLMKLGADRRRMEAQLFGGANVLANITSRPSVGERNAAFARAFLEQEGIRITNTQLGGDRGLHVRFETHTGKAVFRQVGRDKIDVQREEAAQHQKAQGGDVELFI